MTQRPKCLRPRQTRLLRSRGRPGTRPQGGTRRGRRRRAATATGNQPGEPSAKRAACDRFPGQGRCRKRIRARGEDPSPRPVDLGPRASTGENPRHIWRRKWCGAQVVQRSGERPRMLLNKGGKKVHPPGMLLAFSDEPGHLIRYLSRPLGPFFHPPSEECAWSPPVKAGRLPASPSSSFSSSSRSLQS